MGLLDPNLFTNPVLLNQLKGLLGNMPIAQLMRGEAEVSREGLLGEMRKIPVFDPSVSDEFMGNAMNAINPVGVGLGMIRAKTPHGMAKELARRLDKAGIPNEVRKASTTKSAYLTAESGTSAHDHPVELRFSDHSGALPASRNLLGVNKQFWKPDPNFAADVFPEGGHGKDYAESVIDAIISGWHGPYRPK